MSALVGVGLGGIAGAGAAFAVYGLPHYRRPRLEHRLDPYLRDAPRPFEPVAKQSDADAVPNP